MSIINKQEKGEPYMKFYNEQQIRELINSKADLYYVDDGIEEAILKFEDIPDFIVDYNRNVEMRNLKFTKLNKGVYEPDITTIGEFLDRVKFELREKIIERLVALQKDEINPKKYKIIDENLFKEVEEKIEQEKRQRRKNKNREREER